jgi:hypothetical protein
LGHPKPKSHFVLNEVENKKCYKSSFSQSYRLANKVHFCSFLWSAKEMNQRKAAKTKLPPTLPECNGQGKRVGNKRLRTNLPNSLMPKRQALLPMSVNIRSFTLTLARRFDCRHTI